MSLEPAAEIVQKEGSKLGAREDFAKRVGMDLFRWDPCLEVWEMWEKWGLCLSLGDGATRGASILGGACFTAQPNIRYATSSSTLAFCVWSGVLVLSRTTTIAGMPEFQLQSIPGLAM